MLNVSQKSISVYVFLLAATVTITTLAAFILVPEAGRNAKFWLSLSSIFAVEVFTFMFPIAIMLGGAKARRILPFHFGTGTMIVIYDIGVFVLCLAALSQIEFSILLAGQLIWFLCFLTLVGIATVGGMHISTQDVADTACRVSFAQMQDRLASLNNRLAMVQIAETAQTKREFVRICEDARYLSRDSLPGAEAVDTEINQCFDNIGQEIVRLENLSTAPTASERVSVDSKNCSQAIENEIKRLRQLFTKREATLKRLRQVKG